MGAIKLYKNIVRRGASIYSNLIKIVGSLYVSKSYKKLPPAHGEREWIQRWRQLVKHPTVNCYRKYAEVADNPMDIIPEDLMNTIIQPILNPNIYRPYYLDKNSFDKIYGKENLPLTIARRMGGNYLDADYEALDFSATIHHVLSKDIEALIAKPSIDSYGGRNILLFNRGTDGLFRWNENPQKTLTLELLDELLGENWILQKKMKQHQFMAQFNETSVNTFRVHVFTSPFTQKTDIAGICMRVGAKGNWFDNIHSGGFCVSVDTEIGILGNIACDGRGNLTKNTQNNDFNQKFKVPNFDKLKEFAIQMGKKAVHHHSLATDIMMCEDGSFRLIEINIGTFDANMYAATGKTPFGKYTDEVIEYCKDRKKKINFVHVIPW